MKKIIIIKLLVAAFIAIKSPAISQVNCSEWLTPECTSELVNFAQQILDGTFCKQWEGSCDLYRPIYRSGPVSIGTSQTHPEFKLVVTDGIIARKLKICENPGSWCDYVFEDNYFLMPLEEVEQHITTNGHLHKTPSAEEFEAEGSFSVGSVTLDHQEKIEEVFLHLIALKKEANALQLRLKELKKENEFLKNSAVGF